MADQQVHFDTAALTLTRAGITLLRREEGPDAGWHLTFPAADGLGLEESVVHRPLGRQSLVVPAPLLLLLRSHLLGEPLVEISPDAHLDSRAPVHDHEEMGDDQAQRRALTKIRAQADRLAALDPRVRLNRPGAVHQMHVVARRLRGLLRTFRQRFASNPVEQLRKDLSWLGKVLSGARETQVVHEQLLKELDAEAQPVGPVRERIDLELGHEYRQAHVDVVRALNSPRHLTLLAGLQALEPRSVVQAKTGETTAAPRKPTTKVAATHARVVRTITALDDAPSPSALAARWQRVGKAVRSSRDAAQGVAELVGPQAVEYAPAVAYAQVAEGVKVRLGARERDVRLRATLITLARRATLAGENAFTYGSMDARLEQRAVHADRRLREALEELQETADRLLR